MNLRLATTLYFVLVILLLVVGYAWGADNTISVDQIGNNNTVTISQDGLGHTANIKTGAIGDVDYSTFTISQQGAAKTATVEVKTGINNGIDINQSGSGNHTANVQNLQGNGNNITIGQSGAGSHTLIVSGNNVNNGNIITTTQSGNVGSDKWFQVYLHGATNATVNVVQDNPTTVDQASIMINCASGTCGGYSYIKH
jgi:hypothetical protein